MVPLKAGFAPKEKHVKSIWETGPRKYACFFFFFNSKRSQKWQQAIKRGEERGINSWTHRDREKEILKKGRLP